MLLSSSTYAQEWLKNFDDTDIDTAALLIDNLMLISASEFSSKMNSMLSSIASHASLSGEKISFFAEREMEKENRIIKPIFPNSETGRAVGEGVPPVKVDPKKQDVGSEGIIASHITKLCKSYPENCLSHSGPDTLRDKRVDKIVIVTDFIGTGRRMYDMLDSFSKVASVISWHSYKRIEFEIVCYSATEEGLAWVQSHTLKPKVHIHVSCPTIDEAFEGEQLGRIKKLCKKYPNGARFSFGFGHTGSLIVFSHGIPNNAPAILYNSANGWKPLFEGRSTIGAEIDMITGDPDLLVEYSNKVLKIRKARHLLKYEKGELWVNSFMILSVINKGSRTPTRISAQTRIPISQVNNILTLAAEAKWLTARNTLTSLGRHELRWLEWRKIPDESLVLNVEQFYFPSQLRAS